MKRKAKGSVRYDSTQSKKYKLSSRDNQNEPLGMHGSELFLTAMGAPFSALGRGARVPDMNLLPTVTCSLELDITQTVNVSKVAGGFLGLNSTGIYYIEEVAASSDSVIQYASTRSGGTGTVTAPIGNIVAVQGWEATPGSYLAPTTYNKLLPGWSSWASSVSATRVVGAALQVEFTGNDTENQGSIFTFQIAGPDAELKFNLAGGGTIQDGTNAGPGIRSSLAVVEANRASFTTAHKDGCNVSYLPCDNMDLEFGTTCSVTELLAANNNLNGVADIITTRIRGVDTRTAGGVTDTIIGTAKNYGGIGWHSSGAKESSTVRVSIIVHLEGLPLSDNVVVGPQKVGLTMSSIMDASAGLASEFCTLGSTVMTKAATESLGAMYQLATQALLKATNDVAKAKITQAMSAAGMGDYNAIAAAKQLFMRVINGAGELILPSAKNSKKL